MNEGCSLQKCSLEVYFPEAPHLPDPGSLPPACFCLPHRPRQPHLSLLLQGSVRALWG